MALVRSYSGTAIAEVIADVIAGADNVDRHVTKRSHENRDSDDEAEGSGSSPHSIDPEAWQGSHEQPLLLGALRDVMRVWGDATATEAAPHEVPPDAMLVLASPSVLVSPFVPWPQLPYSCAYPSHLPWDVACLSNQKRFAANCMRWYETVAVEKTLKSALADSKKCLKLYHSTALLVARAHLICSGM